MSNLEFKSLEELYNRVKPALYSKVQELKRNNITYVKEVDIWNYLSSTIWKRTDSLSLSAMVENILDLKEDEIKQYVLDILKRQDRKIINEENMEEGTLLWKTKKQ